jgi:hypothetical protein
MSLWLPIASMTALLRRTTKTGWPRQTTLSIWPSSSFEASTVTGAPRALARTLGSHDAMNGTAANTTPTAPIPAVAAVSSRRRLWSTSWTSSTGIIASAAVAAAAFKTL